jgi:hypothetical protein
MRYLIIVCELISYVFKGFGRLETRRILFLLTFGMMFRSSLGRGVTGILEPLFLKSKYYARFLKFFERAHRIDKSLYQYVTCRILLLFSEYFIQVNERVVLVGDFILYPKEGNLMPGVMAAHQHSQNNSKKEKVMAHYGAHVNILVGKDGKVSSIGLRGTVCGGFLEKDRTLVENMVDLVSEIHLQKDAYLLLDAYFSPASFRGMTPKTHIVTRIKKNAIGYEFPIVPKIKKRGRPRKFADKVKIFDLFEEVPLQEGTVFLYPKKQHVKYFCKILLASDGLPLLYVGVQIGDKRICLVSTDLELDPLVMIELYGTRYKIEAFFKNVTHDVKTYDYRFWLKELTPWKKGDKGRDLSLFSEKQKEKFFSKIQSYNLYIFLGLLAQNILLFMLLKYGVDLGKLFSGFYRTLPDQSMPSIAVAQSYLDSAVKNNLHHFAKKLQTRFNLGDCIDLKRFAKWKKGEWRDSA